MTDAMVSLDNEVPVPKYKIGDVIWRAYTDNVAATHDCPDCLGSQKWECTTPGGTTLTVPCLRCKNQWGSDEIPSLTYRAFAPVVVPMTIKSIEIRAGSMGSWGRDRVTYYNNEGCCGTTVSEANVLATKEAAEAVAQFQADEANAKQALTPERLQQKHYSRVTFRDAVVTKAHDDVWKAWQAYRFLAEEVENATEEDRAEGTPAERLENLKWHMDYERKATVCREFVIAMDAIMARAETEFPPEMFGNVPSVLRSTVPPQDVRDAGEKA